MAFFKKIIRPPKLFKRLNAPYRVVFIDDKSLEEVASFRLTKSRIYMLFSTLFVLTIAITILILFFTPLKYYIPGANDRTSHLQVIQMKRNVDSLANLVYVQEKFIQNIQRIVAGEYNGMKEGEQLDPDQMKRNGTKSVLPSPDLIRREAMESVKKENRKKQSQR